MPPSKYATQIDELVKGFAEIKPLIKCIPALKETMSDMRAEMVGMAKQVDTLHESCPFREDIARGANNIARVEKLEGEVDALEKEQNKDRLEVMRGWARIALVAAIGGGAGAGIDKLFGLFN